MGNVVHFRAADMKVGLLPVLIMEQAVIWGKDRSGHDFIR